jgi:glutamate racemase
MKTGGRHARRPVAVFDSGVGGLTVLAALRRLMPSERYLYFGDTARVPYGIKSAATVRRYALEIAEFLQKFRPKIFIAACNTVSSAAMPALERRLRAAPAGVLGVIEPGAEAALAATRGGRVGVIGTAATMASGAYPEALRRRARGDGRTLRGIFTRACPLFVPLAEEGWPLSGPGSLPLAAARRYLAPMQRTGVDTLILGCTHYPLLRSAIASVMGKKVKLVDSAHAAAAAARRRLRERKLLAPPGRGSLRCFVTDDPERFRALAQRFLGEKIRRVRRVNLDGT